MQAAVEEVGMAGVVDENLTLDIETTQLKKPDPANEVREVKIRVPANLPDAIVFNAWQVGMGTVQRLGMGLMVIAFPSMGKGPDGKPVNTIGKAEMIISKSEDVQRVLDLIKVINAVNMKIAEAANNPTQLLGVTLEGKKAKDEALRQLKSAAGGEVPLVIAGNQPRGGIQIAR